MSELTESISLEQEAIPTLTLDPAGFEEEEKLDYLKELNIEESGLDKLIKASYSLLGLQTFFTAGPKEVRAWTFKRGM